MKALPTVFVGNSYRKQLFEPFLKTKTFGNRPHIYLDSSRVLNKTGLEYLIYKILITLSKCLVLSDGDAAEVIKRYKPKSNKFIYWFGWNSAEDLKEWPIELSQNYPNLSFSFLFPDATQSARKKYKVQSSYFKFPILSNHYSSGETKYLISYLGEVDICEDFEKKDKKLDQYLWECAEKSIIPDDLDAEKNFIVKNRMRFLYAKNLKKDFGKDFALVGNDWAKYGLDSQPTDYNPKSRAKLYSQSKICLDLLSKSTMNAHYPRSAELISYSNGILQLKTLDSHELFGNQLAIRTFTDYEDLKKKIEYFSSMEPKAFSELGMTLRAKLSSQVHEHNYKIVTG